MQKNKNNCQKIWLFEKFFVSLQCETNSHDISADLERSKFMNNNTNTQVRVKRVIEWTIPYFGNRHTMPYGKLLVTDGTNEKVVSTKGDTLDSYKRYNCQYITFNRKNYEVVIYRDEKNIEHVRLEPIESAIIRHRTNK